MLMTDLVGAHLWAAGDRASAISEFRESARIAEAAGERADALLATLYAQSLSGHEVSATRAELETMPEGDELVAQVETATRVIG